ncbi:MAG: ankyrin repeat domain-containing protein [Alphaproteobacteria bacterium]|nr:ankyrin repeat domain-containing protein [Alphaproteobacteria bacterium]
MASNDNANDVNPSRRLGEDGRALRAAFGRFFKSLSLYLTAQETLDARVLEAATAGDIARVQKAVAEGGNVNKNRAWHEEFPLLKAIDAGNADMVAALLALKANPNIKMGYRETTPMSAAVKKGNPAIVQMMLAAGGKVEAKTDTGLSLFTYAVATKNDAVADMLLAAGAKPDTGTNGGDWTALFYAARNNDGARVRQLLDLGARTYLRDKDGCSVLDVAAAKENFSVRDMIQAHIDAQVPAWQAAGDNKAAHVSILRKQGYRLTEVFNFETREATLVTHNFETGLDSAIVRDFADVKNKARITEAEAKLPKPAAQKQQAVPAAGK